MTVLTEAEFQRQIIQLAQLQGWTVYHPRISQFSVPGWPDLVLVRDRILYRELKTDTGQATPAQLQWIARLTDAGGDVGLWRPRDMPLIIDTLARSSVWPAKETA